MTPALDGVDARIDGRLLILTLDTRGELNVLSRPVALRLSALLSELDIQALDAVVLRSGKPRSFINGVGLMLAGAVRAPEDVERLTAEVRAAYRALRELPIPTIAAIRGNCFGCGVELALCCDHRVACEDFDTRFRMTELSDYLFVPCFGGTWALPRLIGLRHATAQLLDDVRWDAREACAAGLVNASFPPSTFEVDVLDYARRMAAGSSPPRAGPKPDEVSAQWIEATHQTIEALPPAMREVHRACFSLLVQATRADRDEHEARREEVLASGRTVMMPASKAAQTFFFRRRTARIVSIGRARARALGEHIRFLGPGDCALIQTLHRRQLHAAPVQADARELVSHDEDQRERHDRFATWTGVEAELDWPEDVLVYAPRLDRAPNFAEIASRPNPEAVAAAARICYALARLGFEVARSTPRAQLLTGALIGAYLRPLIAYIDDGGAPADVAATLWTHGRAQPLGQLTALLPSEHPGRRLDGVRALEGQAQPALERALIVSLAGVCQARLDAQDAPHPAILDLIGREVLDWPLARGGLCQALTREHVDHALSHRSPQLARWVRPEDLDDARRYVGGKQDLYG